ADLKDAGDPVELAKRYGDSGADELTFLDVTASSGDRETVHDVVRSCAEQVFIPLTVGGGVRSLADVDRLLRDGADKVSVNTSAVADPGLISEISRHFGNQVLVLSLDARRTRSTTTDSGFEVTTRGGREGTGRCAAGCFAAGSPATSATRSSSCPSTPAARGRRRRTRASRSPPGADARAPAAARSTGSGRPPSGESVRSCSTPSMPTARARASTSNSS